MWNNTQYFGFPWSGSDSKFLPTMWETGVQSLGQEDPLDKEMATHSSTLAWKIPCTESLVSLPAVHGVAKSRTRLSDFTFFFSLSIHSTINIKSMKLRIFPTWGIKWTYLLKSFDYIYLAFRNKNIPGSCL